MRVPALFPVRIPSLFPVVSKRGEQPVKHVVGWGHLWWPPLAGPTWVCHALTFLLVGKEFCCYKQPDTHECFFGTLLFSVVF